MSTADDFDPFSEKVMARAPEAYAELDKRYPNVDTVAEHWNSISNFSTSHRFDDAWKQGEIIQALIAERKAPR